MKLTAHNHRILKFTILSVLALVMCTSLFGLESDIGLRTYDGTQTIKVAVDANHSAYSLKIHKSGTTYGVMLVDSGHPEASIVRVRTNTGTKSLKIFDEILPALTQVTITSSNSNTNFAKVGDTVTIDFTANEALLTNPSVTIDGNAADSVINAGGKSYTATRVMQNGDTDGQIPFTIDFVDEAANAGAQVTSITTGTNVIFDEIPPTLSPVTIASSNATPALAKENDTVTISFTSSEILISMPTVSIDGNAADLVSNPTGNNYTATRLMEPTDNPGQVGFAIGNLVDRAGNIGSSVSTITAGTNVTFQPTLYSVTYNGNGSTGGTAPADATGYIEGASVTVLGSGTLVKTGYNLAGWNTQANGLGTSYAASAGFTIGTADVTLYAVWIQDFLTFTSSGTTIELTGYTTAPTGSLAITGGVTSLGVNAFRGSSGLTGITIPESVVNISYVAFQTCTALTTINIPASVATIGREAFYSCSSLTSINVHAANPDYKSISGVLFNKSGTFLHTVPAGYAGSYTIPSTVTTIGGNAFQHCRLLTSVIIPNSVTTIDWHAFRHCSSLTTVTIPASVSSIDEGAFLNCSSLTAIDVDAANAHYQSIAGVMFSKDGTVLVEAPEAQTGSYTVPSGVTTIFYSAFMYSNFSSITLPSSVTDIQPYAFAFADISAITIPAAVTTIGTYAFERITGLTAVTIPANVTFIGRMAFEACPNLSNVTILATTPPAVNTATPGWRAFEFCDPGLQIHVPAGTLATYQAATGWSDYASIIVSP